MANLTKDQRLIRENPGKSAYELKGMGLSDKGFAELLAASAEDPEKETNQDLPTESQLKDIEEKLPAAVSAKVTIIPGRAMPQVQAARPMQVAEGQAILIAKKGGKRTPMSRAMAERWAKKHPGQYEVI